MSTTGSSTTVLGPRVIVRVKSRLTRRFYEPVIILDVLNKMSNKKSVTALELPADLTESPEHTFQTFVNKLALLCSTSKGVETITALTVLQYPDHIEYRFASNQREASDLIRVKNFLITILFVLGRTQLYSKDNIVSYVLRTSLAFARLRLTVYVRTLKSRATSCISECRTENTSDSRNLLEKLEGLYEKLEFLGNQNLDDDEFSTHCVTLITFIDQLRQSKVHALIYDKTKQGKMDESETWSELQHLMGRLHSYLQAARFLVSIPKQWPELFDKPHVSYVASSIPEKCPFQGKNSSIKMTAENIVGRLSSEDEIIQEHKAHAQALEKFGFDEKLKKRAQSLRPIVHAEVLLLDSIENDGGTHHSIFFKGYKYIGCSKPTCRLCWHYFEMHPSGVKVRQTHRNIYPDWRMPDLYEDQGSRAVKNAEKLMNKILDPIRQDTFRVLREKLSTGKRHDSNTETTYIECSGSFRSLTNIDSLTLRLMEMQVDVPSRGQTTRRIAAADSIHEDEDYTDETEGGDDGGVRL